MLRVGFGLVRAVALLRCLYSAEARQEFCIYRENTSKFEQVLDLLGALFGFAILGMLVFGVYKSTLVFYDMATAKPSEP